MSYVKAQLSVPQLEDANGNPASGYTISSYIWDTSTPTPMYTSSAGAGSATSFTLNSLGQPQTGGGTAVDIFLDSAITYKFIILDAGGAQVGPTIGPVKAWGGFLQSGTGATEREANAKMSEWLSVKDFGATGDGVTNDTAEIMLAVAVAVILGRKLFFPAGTYIINDTVVIDTGSFDIGVILFGEGRNSIIQQTGAGKDAFWFSNTQILQNSGFRDLHIISDVAAGHCINIKYGCTTCFFENVELECYNPNKAVIYGDYTSSGAGIYDTKFKGGSWYVSSSSVQSGFRVIANGTIFNENSFENLRCYNANTAQFFQITTTTTGSIWLINNSWRNINFEVCKGGGLYVDSFKNCRMENISFWDSQGDYTNNLIHFASGVGYESESNLLMNIGRNGDALDAGVCDILISSGQDTTIINCYTQAGDNPVYNFNNKRVTVIGPLVGTINNTGGTFKIGNPFGRLQFPGTVNGAFLDYYDEGTWTAQLAGSTTNPTTPVTVTGYWTRIGRLVTVTAEFLDVSTVGATGNVIVDGLPFNVASSRSYGQASIVNMGSDVVVASPFVGSDFVYFYLATNRAALLAHSAGTGRYLAFTASYTA